MGEGETGQGPGGRPGAAGPDLRWPGCPLGYPGERSEKNALPEGLSLSGVGGP